MIGSVEDFIGQGMDASPTLTSPYVGSFDPIKMQLPGQLSAHVSRMWTADDEPSQQLQIDNIPEQLRQRAQWVVWRRRQRRRRVAELLYNAATGRKAGVVASSEHSEGDPQPEEGQPAVARSAQQEGRRYESVGRPRPLREA